MPKKRANDPVDAKASHEDKQITAMNEWLSSTASVRQELTTFISKVLTHENIHTVDDLAELVADNPDVINPKVGPSNKQKIIRALVDKNLIPSTCAAAQYLLPTVANSE
jgi:hypothetical protein